MPVSVTGPDQQTYNFPDGTSKDDAIAYFKAKGIGASPTPSAAPEQPGFAQRFREGMGVPDNAGELLRSFLPVLAGQAPTPLSSDALASAGQLAHSITNPIGTYASNLKNTITQGAPDIKEAIKSRDPRLAAGPLSNILFRGVLAPVGGGIIQQGGEDVAAGNAPGAFGDAAAIVANLAMLKGGAGPNEFSARPGARIAEQQNKLAYAAGPKSTLPIREAFPDLQEGAQFMRPAPQNVADFGNVIKGQKNALNNRVGAAMGPVANQTITPISIANRIDALITPDMAKTAAGRAEIADIRAAADEYRQPWSIGALDSKRLRLNADLSKFEHGTPNQRYLASTSSTNIAIDKAIADGIRDSIYPLVDQLAQLPPGTIRDLRQRYGNLIEVENSLTKHAENLADTSARVKGGPRFTQADLSRPAYGERGLRRSLMNAMYQPDVEAAANERVKQAYATGSPLYRATSSALPLLLLNQAQNQGQQ